MVATVGEFPEIKSNMYAAEGVILFSRLLNVDFYYFNKFYYIPIYLKSIRAKVSQIKSQESVSNFLQFFGIYNDLDRRFFWNKYWEMKMFRNFFKIHNFS